MPKPRPPCLYPESYSLDVDNPCYKFYVEPPKAHGENSVIWLTGSAARNAEKETRQ